MTVHIALGAGFVMIGVLALLTIASTVIGYWPAIKRAHADYEASR